MGTVTLYSERPDTLIYHENCFHVMDVKVIHLSNFFQHVEFLFSSPASAQRLDLDQLMKFCSQGFMMSAAKVEQGCSSILLIC